MSGAGRALALRRLAVTWPNPPNPVIPPNFPQVRRRVIRKQYRVRNLTRQPPG
jgi:hypothetical protein